MNASRKVQSLKKDAAYVYTGYLLRYVSVIVLIPYYGRVLGPASYGQVLAAMSLMAIVWMVVNYGFSTTGSRELASTTDETQNGHIFGRQICARLILAPVGILIGIVGTLSSPVLRNNPWFGVIATLLGFVNAFNLGWLYQGLRQFRLSLLVAGMAYPLNVLFVLLLVKSSADGVYALLGLLASQSIVLLGSYIVALRLLGSSPVVFRGGFAEIKAASTIFLQSVNAMMMTSGSTYLLSVLSTPEQVGYFGSVEKLISFALAFLQPAGQVLMPTIAHRSKHAPEAMPRLIRKGIYLEMSYGICACLGACILAPIVISLAFGPGFTPSILLLRIMAWSLPFAAFTHSFGLYVLIPQKNERWLVLAFVIGNIFNLAVILLCARTLGGVGVSLARVGGEVLTAGVLVYLAARVKSIRPLPT